MNRILNCHYYALIVIFSVIIVSHSASCDWLDKHEPKPIPKPTPTVESYNPCESVREKRDLYRSLQEQALDDSGFIDEPTTRCDSLLHTGLLNSPATSITAAQDQLTGQWYRYSDHKCYPDQAASTISRDMLLGLLWNIYMNQRVDLISDLRNYADEHDWEMGQGDWKRTYLNPQLYETIENLENRLHGLETSFPLLEWWPRDLTGFEAHLQVLHIMLRDRIYGRTTELRQRRLLEHAERQQQNPLFAFAAGNTNKACSLFMNDELWPPDRLPTSCDRKEHNLNQRDFGNDWKPQSGMCVPFSGVDLIFVMELIDEEND